MCYKLQNVVLPDVTLQLIESMGFSDCTSFTKINVHCCVKRICSQAFARCAEVTVATIRNCATEVAKDAFFGVDKTQLVCIGTLTFTYDWIDIPVSKLGYLELMIMMYVL